MYNIGNLGSFETIPETAAAIYEKNLKKMQELYERGWNINEKISLGKYSNVTPLEIAVITNNTAPLRWLLENSVSLDIGNFTIIEQAAQHCNEKIVSLLLTRGALDLLPEKKYPDIFIRISYGKKFENIPVFEKLGITVRKYGGRALRSAASDGNMKETKMWVEMGADLNYHEPDMVFPYASTPIIEAVRSDHAEIAEYLIKQGSDITITDKYGDRPYSLASKNKNIELMEYLKSLEPSEWHDEQEKLRLLKDYKLPADMLEYLKKDPKEIKFSEKEYYPKYIRFYKFMDLQEMKWKRKKLLSLVEEVENYEIFIVWSPAEKAVCYIDPEHEIFAKVCTWEEFISNPEKYINNIIAGEYDD